MYRRESERVSAGSAARLRNTVSIELRRDADESVRERFTRRFVAKDILKDFFRLSPAEVIALQDTGSSAAYEVSFYEMSCCLRFLEEWRMKAGEDCLRALEAVPKFQRGHVPLVVRMFNPFVPNHDVELFLARHCKEVKGGTWLLDEEGFWTAKRRFAVKLKEDSRVPGGVVHLPAVFYIGPDRGIISYPGQPVFCLRCGGKGHTKASCKGGGCRFCHAEDHSSADCRAPKKCSLCGEEGHLYKACGVRSWAGVVAEVGEREPERQDGERRQDGGQTKERRPHGQEEAQGPPLVAESGGAAMGGVTGDQEPPLVDGSRLAVPGAAGEAPDGPDAKAIPLVESEAADPAAPGAGVSDSLADRAVLQTTPDAFESPPVLTFDSVCPGPAAPLSPALFSSEEGGEEEMPCLGPSAKRDLPSDEDSDDTSRKELRTVEESTGSSDSPFTVGDSEDSSGDEAPGGEVQRVVADEADLAAAESVTEEQRREASEWSMQDSLSGTVGAMDAPCFQGSGSAEALAGVLGTGWSLSLSAGSPLSSESEAVSQVFGAESPRPPVAMSGGASHLPRPARRVGESGTSGRTVGVGRGERGGLRESQGGPIRSTKGRGREALRKGN